MGVPESLDTYRDWRGSAADLAGLAQSVRGLVGLDKDPIEANERLVRKYVYDGVLDRPERISKDAVYGYRHLVQYLAARRLALDDWPLSKIAALVGTARSEELASLALGSTPRTRAAGLVEQFARSASDGRRPAGRDYATHWSSVYTRLKLEGDQARSTLGSGALAIERQDRTLLRITDWCEVLLDPRRIESMSRSELDSLLRAIAHALLDARISRGDLR